MLATHHGFAFVHIPRTGGTSVERALAPYSDSPVGTTAHACTVLPHKHATAAELRGIVGPGRWDGLFTFSTVRDPFDRMVSDYHFFRRCGPDLYPGFSERERHLTDTALALGIDGWLRQNADALSMSQLDYLSDDGERLLVRWVCRLERLAFDFAGVCKSLGLKASLGHHNATPHPSPALALSPASVELIASYCARDLEAFGYGLPHLPARREEVTHGRV